MPRTPVIPPLDPHLTCQIDAIIGHVCRASSGGLNELRALADQFRDAAGRVEAEIAKRTGHPYYDGMFG